MFKQTFNSTSKRTVGVYLDFTGKDKDVVSFWLNGPNKNNAKNLNLPKGLAWKPYVIFARSEQYVILNPFANGLDGPDKKHALCYLPDQLKKSLKMSQVMYLA